MKKFVKYEEQWLILQGWLEPKADGTQSPYTEKILRAEIKRMACVLIGQRKA